MDGRIYFLFEDLFEKYIYTDFPYLEKFTSNVKQNDISFIQLYSYSFEALKSGFKGLGGVQSVGTVNINGVSKQANIVTIDINKNNLVGAQSAFYMALSYNQGFINEYSKLTGIDAKVIASDLEKKANADIKYEGNTVVKIYSSLFGSEFYGLDIDYKDDKDTYNVSVLPIGAGFKLIVNKNNGKFINVDLTRPTSSDASSRTYEHNVKGDIYYKDNLYQVDSTLKIVVDIPYKENRALVRNSINVKYLTDEDTTSILNKAIENYNVLGRSISNYKDKINDYLNKERINNENTTSNETEVNE